MNRNTNLFLTLLLGLSLLTATTTHAQQHQRENDTDHHTERKAQRLLSSIEPPAISSGSVVVEGKHIDYKAVAGTLPLLSEDGMDTTARMSFVAYFKKDVKNVSNRPVTFLYNGGPGSATIWLHMGSFGPKRVVTDSTIHMHGAPYQLADNPYSLLDASDLVFIDAPGTGFGRILPKHEKDYYGVDEDARAFGQFIQRFITQYNRWNSPKFLFGESYGTTRSAVLANLLPNTYGIDLNGVILLSQILNFGNYIDNPSRNPGNDLPYQLALPTYAATAWYHHRLPQQHPDLKAFLQEVENFAMSDYALALAKGATIDSNTFNQIAKRLHAYTGLPLAYIKKANLRIDGGEFEQNLLGADERVAGRLDSRFSGPVIDPLAQRAQYDPQSSAISGAYIALFNNYVRTELNYGADMLYRPNVYGQTNWNWKRKSTGMGMCVNVMPDLARAMITNPRLQVMLNGGYYDLATPFYEGVYELQHLDIPKALHKHIHYAFYKSGHMVYLHVPSLKQLHDNVKQFIEQNYTPVEQ